MNEDLKRKLLGAIVASTFLVPLVSSNEAMAHTVAIGWSAGANAGEVNLFMGSYHQDNIGDGPNLEGAATLSGPGGYNTTSLFTTAYAIANSLPANLPAGNINWYSGYALSSIQSWEAVTMTGLTTAGTYNFNYTCGAGCSAHWSPLATNISFSFTNVDLGGGGANVTPSVPEPESYAMMMAGLSLVVAMTRRRKQVQA